jgi:uncharacterized protein YbaR (Trm112 family)
VTLEELVKEALGCPRCHGALTLQAEPPTLHCTACQRDWPIDKGVPQLADLPDAAG